ncbi:methionyl-tRNA formyltransferase [Chromobacterium violaceum]|uniref:methionyl-tRNA formyltransferase n=1 Tax=Chromobacterium violaceum TaxID=536 RepID=UPI0035A5F4C6
MNKVAFLVVGLKGYEVLRHAIKKYSPLIDFVVLGRDSGVDNDYSHEINNLCLENELPCYDRENSDQIISNFHDYILAVGWRWILPVRNNIVIFHDSLLPKYRGFAPLVSCLINGETEIGATALIAAEKYDRGEVISQASEKISYPIKILDAIKLMSKIYIQLVDDFLRKLQIEEKISTMPQNEALATYSLWRDAEDYWIDWYQSAEAIVRFIDAVGVPYAGARCLVNSEEVILNSAVAMQEQNIIDRQSSIGKVISIDDACPIVVCGKGLLKIKEISSLSGEPILPLSKFRTRFTRKK